MCRFSGPEDQAIPELPQPPPAHQSRNALPAAAGPFLDQSRGVTPTVILLVGPVFLPVAVPERAVAARSQGPNYYGPLDLRRRYPPL